MTGKSSSSEDGGRTRSCESWERDELASNVCYNNLADGHVTVM